MKSDVNLMKEFTKSILEISPVKGILVQQQKVYYILFKTTLSITYRPKKDNSITQALLILKNKYYNNIYIDLKKLDLKYGDLVVYQEWNFQIH